MCFWFNSMTDSKSAEVQDPIPALYWRALRKHLFLGLAVAIAVLIGSVFYTMGQRRIYEATARIIIDPDPPRPLGKDVQAVVDVGNGSYWGNKEYFETQNKILAGISMSREAARALNLQSDTAFIANMPSGQKAPAEMRPVELEDAAAILNSRLKVDPVRDSRLVNVIVSDADPERARRILATVLDIFLERNIERAVQSTAAASEWLNSQTGNLKEQLEKSELALHEYKIAKQILSVSLDDQSNMLRGEMQQLNGALTGVSAKREELKGRAQELDKVNPEEPENLPASELLANGVLSSLRQTYVQAKSELASLQGMGKGLNHPDVEAAAAKLDNTRTALVAEIRNIQGAVRGDLASATREQEGLSGLLARAKQRALDLNMLEIEYRRLERTKENTEKLYGLVVERSKESELTGMLRFNNIRIAEPPLAGKAPVKPRVPINIATGLILGLVLGAGTALARARLDRTVRSPAELEGELGLPLLGVIPSLTERNSGGGYYSRHSRRGRSGRPVSKMPDDMSMELMAHALPSSHAAECVRVIRTSLTFASPDKPYRRILITSGSPAEGKTTVAVSVAIAFAQAGQKVLLIDGDLRRARMHRIFGCPNSEGVTTALQDKTAIEHGVVSTHVPNLSLLPGGPHVPNPAELIQSASFAALLKEMDQRFDRIVIDSPPILAVADASILATLADVSVLVVRAAKTRMDITQQAKRKLTEATAPIAGVVLNAMEPPRWGNSNYYYYYYGNKESGTYGQPYGDRKEA